MQGTGESLAERFSRLAQEMPDRRRVDLELRTLDILLSGLFLLISLPLTIPIAIANLATTGRPVFYRGERVGRGGRIFTMTKFRTLRPGAEGRLGHHLGSALVDATESEVTGVGRWLARTCRMSATAPDSGAVQSTSTASQLGAADSAVWAPRRLL
jgi:lipopolysaccharide/colanic/teichoic acid biosynthesis glycosyltransferase